MPHEPKKRHSKSTKRIRRAAIQLSAVKLVVCKNCHQRTLAHLACRNCGYYDERPIALAKVQVKVTKA